VLRLTRDLPPGQVREEAGPGFRLHLVGRAPADDEALQLLHRVALNLVAAHEHRALLGFYAVHAGYVATVTARQAGLPCILSLRGNDLDRAMFHGPRLPFLLHALQNATAITGVSREILVKARLLSGRSDGFHQVPNSVDVEIFRPDRTLSEGPLALALRSASRPFVAFAGELRFKKGLPLVQQLASRIAARGTGTVVLLGGVRRDEREAMAEWRRAEPAAAARTLELPYEADAQRLAGAYAAMDLLVFPSLWDGMPNALLEAMACGRPCVASATGAMPEMIEDGVSGWLVPPHRLDTFADRVLASLDDAPARERVGAAARLRAERDFRPEAERDALLGVVRGVLR
jgi:glycosyltransferase involved in cell wall biosynthesis